MFITGKIYIRISYYSHNILNKISEGKRYLKGKKIPVININHINNKLLTILLIILGDFKIL